MIPADIQFFQSASEGSSGGVISLLTLPQGFLNAIFSDTSLLALEESAVEYRKFFIVNTNPTDTLLAAKAFDLLSPTSGEYVEIAVGTADDLVGDSYSYISPGDYPTGLSLGDIAPGGVIPIWIRRVTPAGLPPFDVDSFFQFAVQGNTVPGPSPVAALLSFVWGLEPLPEGDTMPSTLNYLLKIQEVDANNIITEQARVEQSVPLQSDIKSADTTLIPKGSVDMPLKMITPSTDILMLVPSVQMVIKLNSISGTPLPVRAGGALFLDGVAITAVFVSNANPTDGNIKQIQASRS